MSTITRIKRETPFVQIDKNALQDTRLSWKSKGLLSYLLSLPDDWKVYINELKNHAKDGRDSTRTALNELIKFGYVTRTQTRETGRFVGYDYVVSDVPQTESPKSENPKSENPPLIIIDNTNNTFNKKEKKIKKENSNILQTTPEGKREKSSAKKERKRFDIIDCDFTKVFDQHPALKQTFLDFAEMRRQLKKPYRTRKGVETKLRALERDCKKY